MYNKGPCVGQHRLMIYATRANVVYSLDQCYVQQRTMHRKQKHLFTKQIRNVCNENACTANREQLLLNKCKLILSTSLSLLGRDVQRTERGLSNLY